MTAFDAHLGPRDAGSAWHGAAAVLRARPAVLIASIVAAATIVCLAVVALAAGEAARLQMARAVDGLQGTVALRPQASRDVAEALRARLEALPFVRGATLRTKESAMVALEKSGLAPGGNRGNPLPDVWIVGLAFGDLDAAGTLPERVEGARRALAALPDVESVDVDADWLATLERWRAATASGLHVGVVLVCAIAWLLLGCLHFVAARAFATAPNDRREDAPGRSMAIVGVFVGIGTLAVAAALVAACAFVAQSSGLDWKPIAVRMGQMSNAAVVGLPAGAFVLAIGLTWLAGGRR